MKIKKPKLLIIGDAEVNTGFARVIQSIFSRISQHYELHQLATHYKGGSHKNEWPLYKAKTEHDPYGYARIPELIDKLNPEIVFIIYDLTFQVEYLKHLNACNGDFKVAIYSPLESGPIAPEIGVGLKGVSAFAVYTKYALQEMTNCISEVKVNHPEFKFPNMHVIPHAVDTNKFHPISTAKSKNSRSLARKALFGEDTDLLDSFIFLNANRNQPRKRIDLSLEAFAIFAKGKPKNVRLFMHMALQDRGWNIIAMAKRLGISDRLIMMSTDNQIPTLDASQLNLIYNACDVGFTTSTGEGWGLVSFEHAATGAPQIIPSHTALKELWIESAEMVNPSYRLTYPGNLTHAWMIQPEDMAYAMEKLYSDKTHYNSVAKKCYENSQNENYNWDAIAQSWHHIFQNLLQSPSENEVLQSNYITN